MERDKLYVARPFLPPFEEMVSALRDIWQSQHLTNKGPQHEALESALSQYCDSLPISLFNNGAIALITALKALELPVGCEVITTPFSFVATAHALGWNGIDPIFADIDEETLGLNPHAVSTAITPNTQAILPVHVYGIPSNTDGLKQVATANKLKILYDAAHAFGVRDRGGSIMRHGDMAVCSFHATKVFNTFEGGAIVCHDIDTKLKIDRLKNFGITDETSVERVGINGKMQEFSSALGLLQLKYIEDCIRQRGDIDKLWRQLLSDVPGVKCVIRPALTGGNVDNFAYFPILITPEYFQTRDDLFERLKKHGIIARRYFYPLISQFAPYRHLPSAQPENLPVAHRIASQVLCLPIYPGLSPDDVYRVVELIAKREG